VNLLQSFAENAVGRDFVVGDVHGCFSILSHALRAVAFNEATDRLFSVGDLVDRGPESEKVIDWLLKPWFHAVRGNHEQMVIDAELGGYGETAAAHLVANGGRWFLGLSPEKRRAIAGAFALMPVAIEVQHASGLVGIVHAEPPGRSWHDFIGVLEVDSEERERAIACALWSRSRINYQIHNPVSGVARVFVGHTPVREVVQFGNVIYIDTGCVFGRRLALFGLDGTAAVYLPGAPQA
jgi:serine/threonine protein phosphatase 1